jgi:hypothetical protein
MAIRPSFMDSPYFVPEQSNWHLKPDAPEDIKRAFDEYMKMAGKSCRKPYIAGENTPNFTPTPNPA